jgi:hypothetical protein
MRRVIDASPRKFKMRSGNSRGLVSGRDLPGPSDERFSPAKHPKSPWMGGGGERTVD